MKTKLVNISTTLHLGVPHGIWAADHNNHPRTFQSLIISEITHIFVTSSCIFSILKHCPKCKLFRHALCIHCTICNGNVEAYANLGMLSQDIC